jgi:hypothetical protein
MPRDQAGRPQETGKLPAASKVAPDSTATSAHCPHCSEHRDRGKVTEKAGASYGRKRH